MTKELQKDKKTPSDPQNKLFKNLQDQLIDVEVDANIHMNPKKEYPIKVRITHIEKARPRIDLNEFEVMGDKEEDNL
jgi:hypothetical protein